MKIKITETQFKKLTMFQPGNEIEVNEKKKKEIIEIQAKNGMSRCLKENYLLNWY